jgi:hypothetical protein
MTRRRFRQWAGAAVAPFLLGLLFGAIVSILNGSSFLPAVVASLILGVGWSWAAVAVVMGALAASPMRASMRGATSLVMAVVGYYATDLVRGVYRIAEQSGAHMTTFTDWHGALTDLGYWSAMAVVSGLLLGWVGWETRRSGPIGLICQLVVPAAAAMEMIWRLRGESSFQPHPGVAKVTWMGVGLAAIAAGAVLVARHLRQPPARARPTPLATAARLRTRQEQRGDQGGGDQRDGHPEGGSGPYS